MYMFSDYKSGGEVPDNTDDNGSAASDPTSYEWSWCHGQVTNWLRFVIYLHVHNCRDFWALCFRLAWSAYLNTCSINEQPTLYHSFLHKQVKIIRFLYCLLVPVFVSNQKQRFFEGIFFHSLKSLWDIKVLRIRTLSQINHYDKVTPLFSPEQVRLLPLLYQ